MPEPAETPLSIKVALKASNGKYVSVGNVGNSPVQANRDAISSREIFEMIYQEDRRIALKAVNGKYVRNEQNGAQPLIATSDAVSSLETFEVINQGGQRVAFQASNGKYVGIEQNTAAPLQAKNEVIGNGESFDLIMISENGTPIVETTVPNEKREASLRTASEPGARAPIGKATFTHPLSVFTVCFSGTACTRDEGEETRPESDKRIYAGGTGYIPVRIHKEISGTLKATNPSVTVRGVGENDWYQPRNNSEALQFNSPLKADSTLLSYVKSYSGGNQYSKITQLDGWSAPALALHGANLAAASGAHQYNFIGHSRGAIECIMAAWFLYAYGPPNVKNIPVNIFAIDPVPGTGEWYGILTQLPPNVANYVGVYSWDQCVQPADKPYMALVPRPNGHMTGKPNQIVLKNSWWPWNRWKYLADDFQLTDPLKPGNFPQPIGFELYACRGRHGTVAGITTADGQYNPANVSAEVAPVPELIYKIARAYLTKWGTTFHTGTAVKESVLELRRKIHTDHAKFDTMGGGETRTSSLPFRPYVRRVSSISGSNPFNSYYMDDVVGDPPYKLAYPVTNEREKAGWVKWKFL